MSGEKAYSDNMELDTTGLIVKWDEKENFRGYHSNELIGQHFRILFLPEERQSLAPEQLLEKIMEEGTLSYDGRRVKKNGSIYLATMSTTVIYDTNGHPAGFKKLTTLILK